MTRLPLPPVFSIIQTSLVLIPGPLIESSIDDYELVSSAQLSQYLLGPLRNVV